MNTTQFDARAAAAVFRGMIWDMRNHIPGEKWRFHRRLGLMQLYLTPVHRLHVWCPSLATDDAATIHDHRFHLTSVVLFGSVRHQEISVVENAAGHLGIFEVVNAKRALKTGTRPTPRLVSPKRHAIEPLDAQWITRDNGYTFPRGCFHRSSAVEGSITLVIKREEQALPARIVGQLAHPPEFGFDKDPWPPHCAEALEEHLNRAYGAWGLR